jgi:hypothetical protein
MTVVISRAPGATDIKPFSLLMAGKNSINWSIRSKIRFFNISSLLQLSPRVVPIKQTYLIYVIRKNIYYYCGTCITIKLEEIQQKIKGSGFSWHFRRHGGSFPRERGSILDIFD